MNRDEFEECRRRFGDEVAAWPGPYRQQALGMQAGEGEGSPDDDAILDRLVLDAALSDTDERKLTQQVLARIDADEKMRFGLPFLSGLLLRPAGMAACAAAVLAALSVGGYQVARLQDNGFESEFLALAAGTPLVGDDLPAEYGVGEEDSL
jgi:hypothetical protein